MIGADLAIAVAGAVLAIAALYMDISVWMVLTVLFVRSVGTAFHSPALSAVTPLLVPQAELTKCAGYTQSLQSISYIVSPAVAALLYSTWELNAIIAIDVLGAVVACIAVSLVDIPKLTRTEQGKSGQDLLGDMKQGFYVLTSNKGLRALLLVGTLYMLVYMPINALYPLMTMEYFAGTPMHVSLTEIAYALGMFGGGLLLGMLGGFKRIRLIALSILLMGISLVVSGSLPPNGFLYFVICCSAMGLSVPFYSGVQTALFQERISPEYLGRVFSLTGSVMSLAMPIGLVVSGAFADVIGVNRWFFLSGVLIVGIAILCQTLPALRQLE